MRLGVVVPTLEEGETIAGLVRRLLAAPGEDDRADEVVVADGGSRDGTPDLARAAGARVVLAERGRGRQLAAGARAAQADVLLFLHADCTPEPGALAELRRAFADGRLGASAMRQRIDAPGSFYRLVERAADARSRRGVVYGDSGLALRRDLYEEIGGFAPLELFEDVELSRRLRRRTRVRVLEDARLTVSPRRWRTEGALRCTLRNWILRGLYGVGVDPARLARLYPPARPRRPT